MMPDSEELREEVSLLDRMVESQLDQLDKLMRAQEERIETLKREIGSLRGIHELRKRKQIELDKLEERVLPDETGLAARH
jgi:hypothetical protein